jgi:hypothetical protein
MIDGTTYCSSFALIDTSAGTNFSFAWQLHQQFPPDQYFCWLKGCLQNSFTSFPLIDTSAGTNFARAWQNMLLALPVSLRSTSMPPLGSPLVPLAPLPALPKHGKAARPSLTSPPTYSITPPAPATWMPSGAVP